MCVCIYIYIYICIYVYIYIYIWGALAQVVVTISLDNFSSAYLFRTFKIVVLDV